MRLFLCLDDKNGMTFNLRRQSRDEKVLEDIRKSIGEKELLIYPYSEKLIRAANIPYSIGPENIISYMPDTNFFVEDRSPRELIGIATTVVIYRWNRHYPADMYFDIDLPEEGFVRLETVDFPGKSHELITKEVYVR